MNFEKKEKKINSGKYFSIKMNFQTADHYRKQKQNYFVFSAIFFCLPQNCYFNIKEKKMENEKKLF